eukprot:CAMPEP_0172212134 /NCGR_PEP_ID=MMETSP1050-20130122/36820_1 /TAXON_ID=233186 /ORGANISM="Cryptomonas curvata, Strain CCAP979/52" /LENGTH=164 /DNA_ID=CAMNT_0012892725 /DNA_START=73 /DNA_END=564 /DNA_ORIENTATION=-
MEGSAEIDSHTNEILNMSQSSIASDLNAPRDDNSCTKMDSLADTYNSEGLSDSLNVNSNDEEAADAHQAEEEDDDNFEITDFSMVTPWERLIFEVEDVLKKWGVGWELQLGSGWDEYPATREHTILNASGTKGVRHRRTSLTYLGRPLVLRHVVWLPEGIDAAT